MALQIPKDVMVGIIKTLSLNDLEFSELVKGLSEIPADYDSDDENLFNHIVKKIDIDTQQVQEIFSSLESLYRVREIAGVHSDTFFEDFKNGVNYNPYKDFEISSEKLDLLEPRYQVLLNLSNFRTMSKAYRLQRDGERLYCTSKILSDIRPIFDENPEDEPTNAVITHTLKLSYHQGGEHKEIHIILDSDDLISLSEVVDRALTKDETLRRILNKIGVKDLGIYNE